jgi:hypothetical protein
VIASVFLVAVIAVLHFRAEFYRGYFMQKQRNAGRDPVVELKRESPIMWWVFR